MNSCCSGRDVNAPCGDVAARSDCSSVKLPGFCMCTRRVDGAPSSSVIARLQVRCISSAAAACAAFASSPSPTIDALAAHLSFCRPHSRSSSL